jgi:Na+-translocating ferredoxin:NAD+ oxidoreductase RnfC subunit
VKRKFLNKKKRACYNCGSTEHFIAKCPYEIKDNKYKKDKKKEKTDHRKSRKYMERLTLGMNGIQLERAQVKRMRRLQRWLFTSHPLHQGS